MWITEKLKDGREIHRLKYNDYSLMVYDWCGQREGDSRQVNWHVYDPDNGWMIGEGWSSSAKLAMSLAEHVAKEESHVPG